MASVISKLLSLFHKDKRQFAPVTDAKVILPSRGTKGSAGYDLYMPKRVVVRPKRYTENIPLNIKAYIPDGEFLLLAPRSSIAKRHLMLCNTIGIIDSDYVDNKANEGNIGVSFYNYGDDTVVIEKGERVAQGIFIEYKTTIDDQANADRQGGHGSTGK